LHWIKHRVFADAMLFTAEHQRMIDLCLGVLHSLSTPLNDMLCIVVPKHFVNMVEPRTGLGGVTRLDRWLAVKIEAGDTRLFDPAAFGNNRILDQ
jgi:hypothetical protein